VFPFAVVFGFALGYAGFDIIQSTFFSTSMIAGASHLAAVQLYVNNIHIIMITMTAVIITLIYSMYSLSLQLSWETVRILIQPLSPFSIADQSYSYAMTEFEKKLKYPVHLS
jgi:predicted branched-subunit amino acid permease